MNEKYLKSLSKLDQKNIFKTTKIKKINFFGQNFHIDFQTETPFRTKNSPNFGGDLNENQLIITGLDWKKFNAHDIFQILKSFECNKGGISEVSLAYFNSELKEKKSDMFTKFAFFKRENRVPDTTFEEDKKIFAQVICDSNRTIKDLYDICNGLEIGNENLMFDMRIVNRKFFAEAKKIEIATDLGEKYAPKYSTTTWNLNEKGASCGKKQNFKLKNFDKLPIKKKFSTLKQKDQTTKNCMKKFNLFKFYPFSQPKFNFLNRNVKSSFENKFLFGKQLDCEKL